MIGELMMGVQGISLREVYRDYPECKEKVVEIMKLISEQKAIVIDNEICAVITDIGKEINNINEDMDEDMKDVNFFNKDKLNSLAKTLNDSGKFEKMKKLQEYFKVLCEMKDWGRD